MNLRRFLTSSFALAAASLSIASVSTSARAATLKVSPQNAQPGDVLTLTIYPHPGEKIVGVGMSAFDTEEVKFFSRPDGLVRAFVGFPFDRKGGSFPLAARVQIEKGGQSTETIVKTTFNARTRAFPTQRITMRNSKTASTMSKTSALRSEKQLVQSKMKNSHPAPLWNGSWVMPARGGASSSAYGRRRYVNGKWWGQHNGTDMKLGAGTPVKAMNSGRVVLSQYLPTLRGNCVVVDHGCNVFSIYMHLSKREVSEGQSVARGQQIGRVGSTGFSTGPHLHFEVRVGWEPVDPMRVLARGVKF